MVPSLTRRGFAGVLLGAAGVGALAAVSRGEGGASEEPRSEPPKPSRTATRQPVGYVAHGAPTLALDAGRGAPLQRWGEALARPRAILMVSAHWEHSPPTLSATGATELVYDFYGFPEELYRVRYDAPPAPDLAGRVVAALAPRWQVERSTRGLDHGAWVPLVHLFAAADVPVLQLSMPSREGPRALFDLGKALAPLRDEGVLLLGSGNLTHNLRRVDWREAGPPPAWAAEFDAWAADVLERRDWDTLIDYQTRSPALALAHPTHEHFLPVVVAAGAGADDPVRFPVTGWEYGSLSRRMVQLG